MAQVHFKLRNQHSDGTADIFTSYLCRDGKTFFESAHQRVNPKHWKKKEGRVIPSAKSASEINSFLDQKERELYEAVRQLTLKRIRITPDALRGQLKGEKQAFWEFYEKFLSAPPLPIGKGRLKEYKKNYPILKRFEKIFGEISFQSIDQAFSDALTKWMRITPYRYTKKEKQPLHYNDSTISQVLYSIRAICNYAVKYKVIESVGKMSVAAKGVGNSGAVYLDQEEIKKIYSLTDFFPTFRKPAKGKMYADIFVLGTQIGLRVSDMGISESNVFIKNDKKFLNIHNKKTKISVVIPLSEIAIEILERFNWNVPRFSDVLMNRNIKKICKLAGVDEPVIHRSMINEVVVEETFCKYEMVSAHTMRRSFATNAFKAGAPVALIMKITGHTTMVSFMKYIRVDNQEAAELLSGYLVTAAGLK